MVDPALIELVQSATEQLAEATGGQVVVSVWPPHEAAPLTCTYGNVAGLTTMSKSVMSSVLNEERPVDCATCARAYDRLIKAHDLLSDTPGSYHG